MKFRAHDTFFIRKGWLSKGMRNVKIEPAVFMGAKGNPMDILGIGANMVKALRYWLQAVKLTTEPNAGRREQSFTPFGEIVFKNDPYIEEMGTLWFLHYMLASNKDEATAWYFFYNEFKQSEFNKEDFVKQLSNYIMINGEEVSERSLEDDYKVFAIFGFKEFSTDVVDNIAQTKKEYDDATATLVKALVSDVKTLFIPKGQDAKHILVYCGATKGLEQNQDRSDVDSEDIRQIDAVTDLLGNKLGMEVSQFTSKESVEEREVLKREFSAGDTLKVLIAIKCLDEGVNIPKIKTAFILASTTNPKEYIQRRGRVLRLAEGKEYAEIYDFITLPYDTESVTSLTEAQVKRNFTLVKMN